MAGKPKTKEERLQQAKDCGILVDPEDEWLLEEYTWRLDRDGYARTSVRIKYDSNGWPVWKDTKLHHCIMGQPMWEGDEIDHINRNRVDDRRSNLRYSTESQQAINREEFLNRSGAKNVQVRNGKYQVKIARLGYTYCLGSFDSLAEAVAERDEWLVNNGG